MKLIKRLFSSLRKPFTSYVKYSNQNPMWNSGYVTVYLNGEMVEHISVDEFLENNDDEDIYCPEDIVELKMKEYGIKHSIIKPVKNWR